MEQGIWRSSANRSFGSGWGWSIASSVSTASIRQPCWLTLGVAVSTIRRWQRRGWIVPVREVRRLPYFDFQEVATARRLTELLAAGMTAAAIEKKLAALARYVPDIKRPLAQLSVIVEKSTSCCCGRGRALSSQAGSCGLTSASGAMTKKRPRPAVCCSRPKFCRSPPTRRGRRRSLRRSCCGWPASWRTRANYRPRPRCMARALAAGGPGAETNFLLAELLYQMHDLSAARERYYMAIELDEDYVEARTTWAACWSIWERRSWRSAQLQGDSVSRGLPRRALPFGPGAGRSGAVGRGLPALGGRF